MRRAEKRDHIVRIAYEFFNQHGYHAVGVDQIVAEAGVAKTTLYRHFNSKDDLIVAVLRMVDKQFREDMRQAADSTAGQSLLLATFDYLRQWFRSADFFGCPFLGATKEYCDPGSSVHREAALHKRLMLAYFEELARHEGFREPEAVARDIHLLHEGATAVAQVSDESTAATAAKTAQSIAARLLKDYAKVASARG